jgi:hypothetical protein
MQHAHGTARDTHLLQLNTLLDLLAHGRRKLLLVHGLEHGGRLAQGVDVDWDHHIHIRGCGLGVLAALYGSCGRQVHVVQLRRQRRTPLDALARTGLGIRGRGAAFHDAARGRGRCPGWVSPGTGRRCGGG